MPGAEIALVAAVDVDIVVEVLDIDFAQHTALDRIALVDSIH